MANVKPGDKEFDILKYLSDYTDSAMAHCMKKYPEREWMFKINQETWHAVYDAHKNGKKWVMLGAATPPELLFAFDAVPMVLDTFATRLASDTEVIGRYIDLGTQEVPDTVCCIDRSILGLVRSGDIKDLPDAYVYSTIPCDSSRLIYPKIAEIMESLGVPTFCIDTPFRIDEFGYKYIADQLKDAVAFLEKVLDTKLDPKRLATTMMRCNEATMLLKMNAEFRKQKPCPVMSRLLVLNGIFIMTVGSQYLVDFLRSELDFVKKNYELGIMPIKEEKFRVTWLQNMVWSNVGLMDWMEKEYGAVVVMDVLGYDDSVIVEDVFDQDQAFMSMARRQLMTPMMHAASGPSAPYIEMSERFIKEYDINMTMFLGHVGCKHTWACGKMVKDHIESKFGLPTLTLDLDAVDGRYKPLDEIKATISEYIESMSK